MEVKSNINMDFIVFAIIITLRRSLADSASHFWRPTKSENIKNPDVKNLKQFQNLGHFFLTESCIFYSLGYILRSSVHMPPGS